jgi:hypothetical protein
MINVKESAHVVLGMLTFHVRDIAPTSIVMTYKCSDINSSYAHRRRGRTLGIYWECEPNC